MKSRTSQCSRWRESVKDVAMRDDRIVDDRILRLLNPGERIRAGDVVGYVAREPVPPDWFGAEARLFNQPVYRQMVRVNAYTDADSTARF